MPNRAEQALLFANLKDLFEPEWYWSSEQYASNDGCAWCQDFNDGNQNGHHETNELRARAVRRLVIE